MKELAAVTKVMMAEKRDILLSILAGFIAGIAAVGLFAASGYLISKSALVPPLYALIALTSTVKLLGFVRALSRYGERYFSHRATFTILSNLRVSFFERLEPLAPRIFQRYRSGDLLARIVGDVESLQDYFLRVFYPPIVLVMVFLATILFTMFFSVYTALVLLVGLVLTVFVVPALFSLRQARIDSRVREGRGALSTDVTELFQGFRDLKIYRQLGEKEEALLRSSDDYVAEQEREGVQKLFSQSVNTFVTFIVTWFVLALGAYLVSDGQLEGIFLAMLLMISLTVFEDAGPMAVFPIHMQNTRRAASRLFSVVEEDGADREVEGTEKLSQELPPAIEMEDVTFRFAEEDRAAVKELNLKLAPGTKTAIVGPSGSGKSTVLQLILSMGTAAEGEIHLSGVSVRKLQPQSIWQAANVVLQENHFFYGTIRENLQLAGNDLTDEQMEAALDQVELAHFALGDSVFEKGENLSGGEKQRLAIARAMLKGGRLWLLDEPTSSVDAVTEKAIYERLFEQAKADTLVLISHRLQGLEKMDQIVVMERGTVVEAGTYSELMARKGYFYGMKEIEKGML
ncbi:thiol reductant ABC exporter subunit CydC [Lentibacillus sediminis]|uniref:thiol reductant ABC exporter subunit CydC n=1 Tax=Lentibacillus sediminis TaxID=1940529 RepID=UPI000C1C6A5D|nr:thiol reductant ABC exporter subunit CydC [Lentibacillus sediminis]